MWNAPLEIVIVNICLVAAFPYDLDRLTIVSLRLVSAPLTPLTFYKEQILVAFVALLLSLIIYGHPVDGLSSDNGPVIDGNQGLRFPFETTRMVDWSSRTWGDF